MRQIKRTSYLMATAVLTLSALLSIGLSSAANAASGSDTCTWTGAGDGTKFSDASNWDDCSTAAPVSGDSLKFDVTGLADHPVLNNDISGLSVKDITNTGASDNGNYSVSGNKFTLTGDIVSNSYQVLTISNDIILANGASSNHNIGGDGNTGQWSYVYLDGIISGNGDITVPASSSLSLVGNNSFIGSITANGQLTVESGSLGDPSNNLTVNYSLGINDYQSTGKFELVNPITIGSSAQGSAIRAYSSSNKQLTLSGDISLSKNVTVVYVGITKITGALSGNYTIKLNQGMYNSQGAQPSLIVASSNNTSKTKNGTYKSEREVTTMTDGYYANGSNIYASGNHTIVIAGNYSKSPVEVYDDGVLMGSGTIGGLTVRGGGTVSPGHSPGCLSTGNQTWNSGAIYTVEIAGTKACSQYDQLKATGTVTLGGATLDTNLLNGYKPKAGSKFTIISNDGKDKVNGTFKGLKEGATFKIGDVVLKISYKGGDGNDVVLSVAGVPGAPDTGLAMITANPIATALVTVFSAGTIALIAKKTKLVGAKR